MQHYYQVLDQLNLNNTRQLKAYLRENPSRLSSANPTSNVTLSTSQISAELFKLFLVDLELKNFKNWDLSDVNFLQINDEFLIENNQTDNSLNLFKELDLSNSNLTGIDLSGLDFSESNFIGASFKNAKLNSTLLIGSDLSHADLSGADLSHAVLVEAIFIHATLNDAKLISCHARKANFANASMQRCRLNNADVCEANFSDTDLGHTSLVASNAQDVNFSRAFLNSASLFFANLSRSNFRGANLDNANLQGSNMTDINLEGTSTNAVSISYDYVSYSTWSDLKSLSQQKYYPTRYLNPQQSTQDKSVGLALLDQCLSTTKPRADGCKVSWADVDSFTLNPHYTCDVKQIMINGRSFLWKLQSKDEATQIHWLHVADVVNTSSAAQDTIKHLIHFQKLSVLLAEPMRALDIKSSELKNNSLIDSSLSLTESAKLGYLDYFRELNIDPIHISLNSSLFNVNALSLQKRDNANSTFSYNVNVDFLTAEIREVLEIIQSISIDKWPSMSETIFSYHLKSGASFNQQQIAWLSGILNRTQYAQLLQKFPDAFSRCEQSCLNVVLSDNDVMRATLIQLINAINFAKPIEGFTQNLSSILPYQHRLDFTDNIAIMLDKQENRYAYATRNQSLPELIQPYSALAGRLNISVVITHSIAKEMLKIGHRNGEILQNHPERKSHLVTNGDGKQFMITAQQTKLNISNFPLADIILHVGNNDKHHSVVDFQILAQQIKRDFNTTLSVALSKQGNDIILKRSLHLESENSQISMPIISVHLKNARADFWYRNLLIIPNTAKTKLTMHGLNMQLTPFPLQLKINNGTTDFINAEKLEQNTAIFIPRQIQDYSFFRSHADLIVTNAFTANLEINQLCNIVLQNFYPEQEKAMSFSLEFINKKILLVDHRNNITNAVAWNDTLHQFKNTLFSNAYQQGQRASLSVYREDCYQPPLINLRRLNDYYYQNSRHRRSIVPASAPIASNSASTSMGLLQNSLNTVKHGVKWLGDQVFSPTASKSQSNKKASSIHDENIWEAAYNFYADHDRKQLKHQKTHVTPHNINKPIAPTPHISHSNPQETFSNTHHFSAKHKNKEKPLEKRGIDGKAKFNQQPPLKSITKEFTVPTSGHNRSDFFKVKLSKSKKSCKVEKFSSSQLNAVLTPLLIQGVVHSPKIISQPQLHNQTHCISSPPLGIGNLR